MTQDQIDALRAFKINQHENEATRCELVTKLLLKLGSCNMTPEEQKMFSLSFVGPNQRKLGKALASLTFWKDEASVRMWLNNKNQTPENNDE